MSDSNITRYKPGRDTRPDSKTDWARLHAMTDGEAEAAALDDPDNLPLTNDELATAQRLPQVKTLRQRLGMTQEQFAHNYRLPIGTVRDWEQGRSRPDAPAQALLMVIEREPAAVQRALGTEQT
jgi:putative transcriptional regulator